MHDVTINGVRYVPAPPECENPELLDIVYDFQDVGKVRIRDYLSELLLQLWRKEENFNSKRPFGSSGWSFGLYEALASAKVIDGVTLDESGHLEGWNSVAQAYADELISGLIVVMCTGR